MSAPVAMTADDHFARACAERDRADEWAKRADDLSKKLEAAEAARDEATRRLAEEKATVAAQSLDLFGAIDAQDKAERRLAVVEEAVRGVLAKADRLVTCLRDVTDIENLNRAGNICRDLRAALKDQP